MSKLNAFVSAAATFARVAAAADHTASQALKPAIAQLIVSWEDVPTKARPSLDDLRALLRRAFAPAYGLGVKDDGSEFTRPTTDNYDKEADVDYNLRKDAARQRLSWTVKRLGAADSKTADAVVFTEAQEKAAVAFWATFEYDKAAAKAALAAILSQYQG